MTLQSQRLVKKRIIYAVVFLILLVLEVLIALFVHDKLIRPYIGDVIVVMVLYVAVRMVKPEGFKFLPLYIFLFATLVEYSQFFKLTELLNVKNNAFLRVLIGSVFDVKDILSYGIGCILLGIYEWIFGMKPNSVILEEKMAIKYRAPMPDEIEKISEQIMISYTSAYKGQMHQKYLSSLPSNHWVPILHASIQNGDTCLVAEQEGKIVGSTVFGKVTEGGETYAEWHAFYLLPQYIGHGIGHSFYQRIMEEMMKQGCNFCILEVLSTNERAIKFYLSHGFIKTNTFTVHENGMTLSCDKMMKNFE